MVVYSIIIPHKNIPHLLQRCLDSIPRRDDIQIIVADDNSDPDKVDFDNFPGLKDTHVEVVFGKNENGCKGAGYARNLGLKRAKGKWLIFADADDFFNPCFEDALDRYKDAENDLIFFKATSVYSDSFLPCDRDEQINHLLTIIKETGNWDIALLSFAPWGKFFKRKMVEQNDISFLEVLYSNDVLFSVKSTMSAVEKLADDAPIYCITYRNNSLTEEKTAEAIQIRFDAACQVTYYLKKYKKERWTVQDVYNRWMWLCNENFILGLKLLPKVLQSCGFTIIKCTPVGKLVGRMRRFVIRD